MVEKKIDFLEIIVWQRMLGVKDEREEW